MAWAAALALDLACGGGAPKLDRTALMDPASCATCHPDQFTEWSGSMHAYAADDPVFLAMNQRGQRETGGALGDFCVKCHAPVAVREGLTHDGLNLAGVPASAKGVTCYLCHSVADVQGTHDDPLVLTTEAQLFGPIADPDPSSPHRASHGAFVDSTTNESAEMCGSCHDIVNGHGAALERTYQEWMVTLFADPPRGISCAGCHMDGRDGPAATTTPNRVRRIHSHAFPAVDRALGPFPGTDAQAAAVQAKLDSELQATVCVDQAAGNIQVFLDNIGAGHGFPSGAAQDRRVWVDLAAYAGDQLLLRSGTSLAPPSPVPDPDLWLIRDCIYGADGNEVHMFWDATATATNQIPGAVMPTLGDQSSFTRSHLMKLFPATGALPMAPDKVTLAVHVTPIGADVLADLVASGDLDPAVAAAMPTYTLGAGADVVWMRATADKALLDPTTGDIISCAPTGTFVATPNQGKSHAQCPPAPPPP